MPWELKEAIELLKKLPDSAFKREIVLAILDCLLQEHLQDFDRYLTEMEAEYNRSRGVKGKELIGETDEPNERD